MRFQLLDKKYIRRQQQRIEQSLRSPTQLVAMLPAHVKEQGFNNIPILAKIFCSYSTNTWMCVGRVMQEQLPRRRNGRIASYATVSTTQKTHKKIRKALAILML